jgi:hypothetical protein
MILKKIFNNRLFDLNIFLASITIVFIKWGISFFIFKNETIINKILFDIEDFYYLPFILNLINFDFSPDYLNNIESNMLLPIPIYSIIFHAISYKLIGFLSFFVLEIIFLYIFLIIILKILLEINVEYYLAIFISLFIFIFPSLIFDMSLLNINFNIISGLFSFRFPRPLVTSCYYFWGIYLALRYYKQEQFSYRNFLLTGTCLALTFVSYYYNFINLFILFLIILFTKMINDKSYLKKCYLKISLSILIFIVLVSPFLYLYSNSANSFSEMMGVISLNLSFKIELLLHFLSKIFSLKFLSVFFFLTLFMYVLLKLKISTNKKNIKFFYFIFLATVISPFFFVIVSPSISEIHNFLNWIIISAFFVIIIFICILINFLINKNFFNNFRFKNFFFLGSSIVIIFLYQYLYFENFVKKKDINLRSDYLKLQKLIDINSNKLNNLLSFSPKIQVLWLLKNKNDLSTVESSISSLEFKYLEKNLIQNFKFLNISLNNFKKILSNKKSSWRYNNEFVRYLSWYKYQANSLITFKNSKDFSRDEMKFIENSSPTKTQQIILPKFEINRFVDLFNNVKFNEDFKKPDLIILKKNSLITKYSSINDNFYCELDNYAEIKVYVLNKLYVCK